MEDKLSKNDLFILMESYKNNIQLNTTLLEQQKQLLIMNTSAIDKQKEFCETLDKFIQNVISCSEKINENHSKLTKLVEDKTNTISNQITTGIADSKVEHSGLRLRIYMAMIGMVGIIISLISLAMTYSKEIHELTTYINKIVK
jgi:hypothetical protein